MSRSDAYTVLLVVEHPRLRRIYSQLLASAPELTVAGEASSGEKALEKLPTLQPDIVVTDQFMPGIGGCQFTRRVRESYPQLPVLIISTQDERSCVRDALAAGANGYLVKHCSESTLSDAIRRICEHGYFLCDHFLRNKTRQSLTRLSNLGSEDF